ncbi:MAG: hypothetical protein KC733_07605 [Candidatus Omnitrophica bacterium]|nr:hypothetical protein [Candidatus Omnitrophota bacterium]
MDFNLDSDHLTDPYHVQAMLLAEVVKRTLERRGGVELSSKPNPEEKPITEYMRRVRVSSVEKFDDVTYIATVNYYLTQEDMANHKAIGALVLYMEEKAVVDILSRLNYPISHDEEPEFIMDACGTFCNLIGGNFKSALTQLNYNELYMSHFSTYKSTVPDGVEYHSKTTTRYEIPFEIDGKVSMYFDLIMGPISKS